MNGFAAIARTKTNAELLTMVYELHAWSPEMLQAIEAELAARNILPVELEARKQAMIDTMDAQLSMGKPASLAGQIIGWAAVLFFGIIGFAIAYNYMYSKQKNLVTRKRYFIYNKASREMGMYMLYGSIAAFIIGVVYVVVKSY
jgi:hypothetical protein